MKSLRHVCRRLVRAAWLVPGLLAVAGGPVRAETPLSADAIVQRAVERVKSPGARSLRPNYVYTKHTLTEELNLQGKVKDRTEKYYEVLVESGVSYLKLTRFNGQDLSPAQLKKQEEREQAERKAMTDAKADQRGDERENFLKPELVEKYKFTLVGHKTSNGRDVYELAFEPKSANLPVHKLTDRFLNNIAGTVWIDAQEFEIAHLELHLKSEVTLWGGMVGTLRQGTYTLERTRLPDGAWFNDSSHGMFEGRKLLEPLLIRSRSDSSNYHRSDVALK